MTLEEKLYSQLLKNKSIYLKDEYYKDFDFEKLRLYCWEKGMNVAYTKKKGESIRIDNKATWKKDRWK